MSKTATPTASPAPTVKPAGIKKVNLLGIAAGKKDTAQKDYPILPDDADNSIAELVTDILDETERLKALEGSLEAKKGELASRAGTFYFEHLHGKHDIPSSIEAKSPGGSVLVTMQNRYKAIEDDGPLVEAIGDRAAEFFRQSFTLKIDGDKIPEAVADDLITGLQELFASHGAAEALTAKAIIKPTPTFHVLRHTALSVAENLAVQKVIPIIPMVKTSTGRKKAA